MPPPFFCIVKPVTRIKDNPLNFRQTDPGHHLTRGEIVRAADHLDQIGPNLGGLCEAAVFKALAGSQQDGDLGQTGGIHHRIAVHLGKTRQRRVRQVDQPHCHFSLVDQGLPEFFLLQGLVQFRLEPPVPSLVQRTPGCVRHQERQGWRGCPGTVGAHRDNGQSDEQEGGHKFQATLENHFESPAANSTFFEANMRLEVFSRCQ